jgi:hypothetical protein
LIVHFLAEELCTMLAPDRLARDRLLMLAARRRSPNDEY